MVLEVRMVVTPSGYLLEERYKEEGFWDVTLIWVLDLDPLCEKLPSYIWRYMEDLCSFVYVCSASKKVISPHF